MEGYDTYMAQVAEVSMKDGVPVVHKVTVVADLGRMVNPDTVEAQIQSSIIFGLTAALYGEITLDKGRVQQTNFHHLPAGAHERSAGDRHHAGAEHREAGRHRRAGDGTDRPGGRQRDLRRDRQARAQMPLTADNIARA